MREPMIQFPVTCPLCGNEALGEYPVAEVAGALLARTGTLRLHSRCHSHDWTAAEHELDQIRAYLGAWIPALPSDLRKAK
jgi:hypothetical protein